jgi:hypothetical protein
MCSRRARRPDPHRCALILTTRPGSIEPGHVSLTQREMASNGWPRLIPASAIRASPIGAGLLS